MSDRAAVLTTIGILPVVVAIGVGLRVATLPKYIGAFYSKEVVAFNSVAFRVLTPTRCQNAQAASTDPSCLIGASDGQPTVAIWGDSSADTLTSSFHELYPNRTFLRFILHSCPPIIGTFRVDDRPGNRFFGEKCARNNQEVLSALITNKKINTVIVFGHFRLAYDVPGQPLYLVRDPKVRLEGEDRMRAIADQVVETVQDLAEAGKTVVLIGCFYATPEVSATGLLRKAKIGLSTDASIDLETYDKYSRDMNVRINEKISNR
jgi:hypothetical protein